MVQFHRGRTRMGTLQQFSPRGNPSVSDGSTLQIPSNQLPLQNGNTNGVVHASEPANWAEDRAGVGSCSVKTDSLGSGSRVAMTSGGGSVGVGGAGGDAGAGGGGAATSGRGSRIAGGSSCDGYEAIGEVQAPVTSWTALRRE
ncbi:unnamed protein product [Protopolystoma xenopodis]|uniref:Uncharacterized protein n=1 Tax=Protopolystoma xenopodis TaxID=117903 RepID=A0A448XP80_9PLAT|nr:unnamed protein product [Protopolystoma xenopodis]